MAFSELLNNATITTTSPTVAPAIHQQNHLLLEKTVPHFNRFQFFFDSSHIQQLARSDRRFLQRIFRERSHANVNAFYTIDCEEEEDLPVKFHELYEAILGVNGNAIRTYQLIVNTLTFYYSRLTWATSVQKYVTQFLVDSVLCPLFHKQRQLADHSLFQLELLCLLSLFVLRYASAVSDSDGQQINEDTVVQLLTTIREKGGEDHLAAFVIGPIVNHFGCSIELRLRRIVERMDVKVKVFRDPPPFSLSSAGVGRGRKLSLNTLESTGRNGRCGSSGKGTSSEPAASDVSTDNSAEMNEDVDDDMAEKGREAGGEARESARKVGIGTARRRQTQQQRRQRHQKRQRDGRHSSSSIGTERIKEEGEEQRRTPSPPPAKRLRSGSNAAAPASNKGGRSSANGPRNAKGSAPADNISEQSTRSSCSSNGAAAARAAVAADFCPRSLAPTTPNFPITRSATAHASQLAAASCSSRSSSSTNASSRARRTAGVNRTSTRTDKTPSCASLPTTRAMRSTASSLGARISKFSNKQRFGGNRKRRKY